MNKQQQQAYGHAHGDVPYCSFHPRELVVGVCAHCLKDRLLLLLLANNNYNNKAADDDDDAAAAQNRNRNRTHTHTRTHTRSTRLRRSRRTNSISRSLPKVFALGSSFLQRLDSSRHQRQQRGLHDHDGNYYSDDDDGTATASVASLDEQDSFISIKFEDNGNATWDSQHNKVVAVAVAVAAAAKKKEEYSAEAAAGKPPPARSSSSSSTTVVAVVEHVKRGGVTRWRKQVLGRLLQRLARWRRSAAKAGGSGSGGGGAAAACHCHVGGLDGNKAAAERSKARGRSSAGWIRSLTTRRRAHGDRAW